MATNQRRHAVHEGPTAYERAKAKAKKEQIDQAGAGFANWQDAGGHKKGLSAEQEQARIVAIREKEDRRRARAENKLSRRLKAWATDIGVCTALASMDTFDKFAHAKSRARMRIELEDQATQSVVDSRNWLLAERKAAVADYAAAGAVVEAPTDYVRVARGGDKGKKPKQKQRT